MPSGRPAGQSALRYCLRNRNAAGGIRIATGINALAMTWGNIYGCVFTWDFGEYAMDAIGRDKTHPYKKTPVGIHRGVNRE